MNPVLDQRDKTMNRPSRSSKILKIAPFLIIAVGACVRCYHLAIVGFSRPFTLGGLYLEFSRQIFLNRYGLPITIPYYSQGGLPFAYPPLPFYIEAFLTFTLGLPKFFITNALPPLVSVVSLFAFYHLARKTLKNPLVQLFTLTLYAILPLSFMDQVEAAGLAESFGALFIILFLDAFWEFYQDPDNTKSLLRTAILWSFCIFASPASAYVSVFIFIAFFLMLLKKGKGQLKQRLLKVLLLGGIAVLVSSLYWGIVIQHHGIGLFIDSFLGQHGAYRNFIIDALLSVHEFIYNPISAIFPLLFIFTLSVLIYFREYGILLMLVLAGLVPRELWVMGIIGVIIAGYAVDLLIQKRQDRVLPTRKKWLPFAVLLPLVILLIAVETTLFCLNRELVSPDNILSPDQIELLENIDAIDPAQADLVVIGGNTFLEWTPYLAKRTVLNVWYGTEFAPEKSWLEPFNESLKECDDLQCVNQLVRDNFQQSVLVLIDGNAFPALGLDSLESVISEYQESGIFYYLLDKR